MANQLNCLRCGAGMNFLCREKMQLGQTGWLLGDLPNLVAGAMEVEIYACPKCGGDRLRLSPARRTGRTAAQKVPRLRRGARFRLRPLPLLRARILIIFCNILIR